MKKTINYILMFAVLCIAISRKYDLADKFDRIFSPSSETETPSSPLHHDDIYIPQTTGGYIGGLENNGYDNPSPTPSNPRPSRPARTKEKCTLCDGKGTVVSTKGVSLGMEKWCSECEKQVPSNHHHETCPSCKGEGEW